MGQAKARGTFEQRKAQALAEGREKRPSKSVNRMMREEGLPYTGNDPDMAAAMFLATAMGMRWRNR